MFSIEPTYYGMVQIGVQQQQYPITEALRGLQGQHILNASFDALERMHRGAIVAEQRGKLFCVCAAKAIRLSQT